MRIHDILVIDDEPDIRTLISDILKDEGYQTRVAGDGAKALQALELKTPNLIIMDVWLGDPQYDGLKLLELIKKDNPDIPIIMISGHGTVETAVRAIKMGAYDFIEKPFKLDRLLLVVKRALEAAELKKENRSLKQRYQQESQLVGNSSFVQNLRKTIEKVASTNSRILICGASGVGKELIAHEIHLCSKRKLEPFIVVSCQNVASDEFEEYFFGHEATSTISRQIGALEQANGGTIYLDEISALPESIQAKLIRVLHENTFQRVEGRQKISIDVRFIASTKNNMKEAINAGNFREDLYYRLNVVPITVPSLKERQDDLPALINHFSAMIAASTGIPQRKFSDSAITLLKAYGWPGNIHELRNIVERILIMTVAANDVAVSVEELPAEIRGDEIISFAKPDVPDFLSLPLREAREYFEREYLLAQVNKFSGNISRTATFIGMERSALHRKLRQLQVDRNKKLLEN